MSARDHIEELLAPADVRLNGDRPWDIRVHDERLFRRVLAQGTLGLGEAYMEGWWECDQIDEMIHKVLRVGIDRTIKSWALLFDAVVARITNRQTMTRARKVGRHHYDIGNELYERMLDRRLLYSCGYWKDAQTLDEAQEAKLELSARKLGLQPGMRVLDIGCGWGGTAHYFAEKYACEVVGVTISHEQVTYGRKLCEGLPVEIRFQDYRELDGRFDRIISIGMFEHVGYRNYRTFMEVVRRNLTEDGLFLLHTIGGLRTVRQNEPWLDRYIFPNSMLPSARWITKAIDGLFVMEDWHNFGAFYDLTLQAWYRNFEEAWPELAEMGPYDERFRRMWTYYLLTSAGGFRARKNQLWQVVLSPKGVPGGYESVR
ncbi:MAG: cyclopropane fatty acyl phospholipid synthase [bacterium]